MQTGNLVKYKNVCNAFVYGLIIKEIIDLDPFIRFFVIYWSCNKCKLASEYEIEVIQ